MDTLSLPHSHFGGAINGVLAHIKFRHNFTIKLGLRGYFFYFYEVIDRLEGHSVFIGRQTCVLVGVPVC